MEEIKQAAAQFKSLPSISTIIAIAGILISGFSFVQGLRDADSAMSARLLKLEGDLKALDAQVDGRMTASIDNASAERRNFDVRISRLEERVRGEGFGAK